MNHNHPTRDIKPYGKCPGCDSYHLTNILEELTTYLGWKKDGCTYESLCGNYICDLDQFPFLESVDSLIPLVEKLGLNMYVSYLPSKKKYRARVWEYFRVPHNEKQSEYIYDKTPALALARALVKAIREKQHEKNSQKQSTKN